MTMIVTHQETAIAARAPHIVMPAMTDRLILRAVSGLNRVLEWRRQRATEKALAAMPHDMRKDFGWPAPDRR